MVQRQSVTFIATLGGKPDIITFALDYLLDHENVTIEELILIHLSYSSQTSNNSQRTMESLRRLSSEFKNGRYRGHPIKFTTYPIQHKGKPLADIHNDAQADAVWRSINALIYQLKSKYRTLHICISGGRRMLALQTLSASIIHFGHHDVLWHMYTPNKWKEKAIKEGILHLPENSGFQLIRVPMVPWGAAFPGLSDLSQHISGKNQIAQQLLELNEQDHEQCHQVYEQLSKREQETLRTIVQLKNLQDTAKALHITLSTVNSHKTKILDQCRIEWEVEPGSRLDYHFLIKKFGTYFSD